MNRRKFMTGAAAVAISAALPPPTVSAFYGASPAMMVLPTLRQLQAAKEQFLADFGAFGQAVFIWPPA